MEEKRLNWQQIIVTAILTGMVTVAGGMIIYYFQLREPRLVYSTEDTIPFESPSENLAIYHVKIRNDGKKIVENVICQLSYYPASIKKHRIIAEPSISYKDNILDNSYRVEFSHLNPNESVGISILASCSEKLASRPKISLRGKGITGVEESEKKDRVQNKWLIIIYALSATYLGLLTSNIIRRRRFQKIFKFEASKHRDDQRKILSYLCGIHGLSREVDRYLSMSSEAFYWAEADRFSTLVIENPSGEDVNKLKKVLEDLLTYADISTTSEGIVHYNIAKISKIQGNNEKCDYHINNAKKLIPKLIEARLKIDPIFKNDK